ncbi:MAG TPA: prolipoprotein diacylglyceryl transferase family protein, partial [Pirellulaceae bacterium]|nr:prolipoprotein diacylglyceryl transferase family protein [Pirellulaceae bacterium]
MRSTLFYIPAEVAGVPVFGVGWLLGIWLVLCIAILFWIWRQTGDSRELVGYLPFLAIVALVIVFMLPMMMQLGSDGQPLGVPIRGFGVMFMLATVAGVGLAAWRARQMGIDPDVIYSLAFWMVIAGLIGARLFFVVQYWHEFQKPTVGETIQSLMNFTKGGLVVYGSVLTGLPVGIWYLRKRGLPILAVADLIAPSMVVGLALGRIGCFMNGCCFGGECLPPDWRAMTFPVDSPPYQQQITRGWMSGVWLAERDEQIVVNYVAPGSPAEAAGVRIGDAIASINGAAVTSLDEARDRLMPESAVGTKFPRAFVIETTDGRTLDWLVNQPPQRTVPIHPTQLYAALDAALLALVLWFYYPFRRRDGEVFALLITIHPLSRFL